LELPPLVLGTVLNYVQSQYVLKNGLLPLGTLVRHVSAGYMLNSRAMGIIYPPLWDVPDYKSVVWTDVRSVSSGGRNWASVKQLEIFPPMKEKDFKEFVALRGT